MITAVIIKRIIAKVNIIALAPDSDFAIPLFNNNFITFSFITVLFTMAALVCSITLRKIHIPALLRHQNQHAHLSDHHLYHGEEIVLISTISTVSWVTVLIIYAVAQIGAYTSPYPFIIGYIIFVLVMSGLTKMIKRHLLDSRKHKKA